MNISVSTLDERINASRGATQSSATEYFVNMGPQHPSTHGVLRLVLKLNGETVEEVIPVLGYIHRGIEKISEHLTLRQSVQLTDRMDYLSAFTNNWALSRLVEQSAGIEVNERIETVRTLFAELQRIQSHQLWWGVLGMDLGAFTPFLYGFRDREILTDIFEETTGARLTMNYVQPGGLMYDLHPNFVRRVKDFITYFRPKLAEYEALFSENIIVQRRLRNIGILDRESAVQMGATGPVLRASGVAHDLRQSEPYGKYSAVRFEIPVGTTGDSWDRYRVRIEEMRQSMSIVEQLIDNIPEGKHMVLKPAAKIKVPEGRFYTQMETARGILGALMVSDGSPQPWRMHYRSPCFNNLWAITSIARGWRMADLITILSTLDIVVPDIDR